MFVKKNNLGIQLGFTLIEIMIVVAITSILASLFLQKFALFQAKAVLTEGRTNIATLETLVDIFRLSDGSETPNLPFTGHGQDNGSGDPATSCNIQNSYGFTLSNCQKTKFYYYQLTGSGSTNFIIEASARGDHIYSSCGSSDIFTIQLPFPQRRIVYLLFPAGSYPTAAHTPYGILKKCT